MTYILSVKEMIYTRLSQRLLEDEDAPYSVDKVHMTATKKGVPTEFPTLNVDFIGETSIADDLEKAQQNAIISTIELKAYSNTSLEEASEIMDKAGDVMIAMGYSVIQGPEDASDTNHVTLARFRRIFGDEDIKNI